MKFLWGCFNRTLSIYVERGMINRTRSWDVFNAPVVIGFACLLNFGPFSFFIFIFIFHFHFHVSFSFTFPFFIYFSIFHLLFHFSLLFLTFKGTFLYQSLTCLTRVLLWVVFVLGFLRTKMLVVLQMVYCLNTPRIIGYLKVTFQNQSKTWVKNTKQIYNNESVSVVYIDGCRGVDS